jgi:1-deoxy-D-xylulose-5-phosphate reductoisomerase
MKRLAILGSTGSIGANTLDVVARHPDRFEVTALAAGKNVERLAAQCLAHRPKFAVMTDAAAAERLRAALAAQAPDVEVLAGSEALERIAAHEGVDAVMAAIVGAAGLPATLAAARAGKEIHLANKEALVMSGALFMRALEEGGASLLPIDSEHSAIFQSLPRGFACGRAGELDRAGVRKLILTASGGPFRTTPVERLARVTPQQACAHPNWVMGKKISVDSATMMNKGLEVIEAHWLFAAPLERIQVVIHPQSTIHSMVEYADGSVIAQLGAPDMRTPIACASHGPSASTRAWRRSTSPRSAPSSSTASIRCASPACARAGGDPPRRHGARGAECRQRDRGGGRSSPGACPFTGIPEVIESVLGESSIEPLNSLDQVYAVDIEARGLAARFAARHASTVTVQ